MGKIKYTLFRMLPIILVPTLAAQAMAGIFPAVRASRLNPVEALRYE
jgi:ABC-type lipoprotein release transport system permease subunit